MSNFSRACSGIRVDYLDCYDEVKIYSIQKDASGEPVYIGSTNQPIASRIRAHILDANKGSEIPIHEWIRNCGGRFVVKIIDRAATPEERHEKERYWISKYEGSGILNLTDGGPGLSGHKYAGTEHAFKGSEAKRTGDVFFCNECGVEFYRKRSEVIKGNCRFCSRECYQSWQRGKTKSNENGLMGVAGRTAALKKRRGICLH